MAWKVLIVVLGAFNVAFGVVGLVAPARVARIIGLAMEGPSAHGEMRAVFGGLVVALGAVMIVALRSPGGAAWLRVLAVMFAGLALGRVVSLVTDGLTGYTLAALALEAGTAVVLASGAGRVASQAEARREGATTPLNGPAR